MERSRRVVAWLAMVAVGGAVGLFLLIVALASSRVPAEPEPREQGFSGSG